MKKIIQILTLVVITTALVSSCTVEKRLHTKGLAVSWNSKWKKQNNSTKNNPVSEAVMVQANEKQTTNSFVSEPIYTTSTEEVAAVSTPVTTTEKVAVEKTNDIASRSNVLPQAKHEQKTSLNTQNSSKKAAKFFPQAISKKQAEKATSHMTSSAGGGKASGGLLVLYIILCLFPFINLIPVYLTDGSITLNFWVTLILDILGALPGIIFALLVVLGVVSL